jgi:hypothetical protein
MSEERENLPFSALYSHHKTPVQSNGKGGIGSWQITVKKAPTKGRAKKELKVSGYETQEAAWEGTFQYQYALMRDHALHWVGPLEALDMFGNQDRFVNYRQGYEAHKALLLTEDASGKRKRASPNSLSIVVARKVRKHNIEIRALNSLIDDHNAGIDTDIDGGKKKKKVKIISKSRAHNLFHSHLWTDDEIASEVSLFYKSVKVTNEAKHSSFLEKRSKLLAENMIQHKEIFQYTKKHYGGGSTHQLIMKEDSINTNKLRDRKRGAKKEDDSQDFSPVQLDKISKQCLVFKSIAKIMIKETEKEMIIVADFQAKLEKNENITDELTDYRSKLLEQNSMGQLMSLSGICNQALVDSDLEDNFKGRTVEDWWKEFKNNKFLGVKADMRGLTKQTNYLEANNMTASFKLWMTMEKDLCVNSALNYLNGEISRIAEMELIEDKLKALLEQKQTNGDSTPLTSAEKKSASITQEERNKFNSIDRSTAHRWMRIAGARFCVMQKNYYTDSHENKENKNDREIRYIPSQMRNQLRAPVWYEIEETLASKAARNHARACLHIDVKTALPGRIVILEVPRVISWMDLIDGLPKSRTVTEVKMIKIHVDFLSEVQCEKFRKQMMVETGKPGEYFFPIKVVDVPFACTECSGSAANSHFCSHGVPLSTRKQTIFEIPNEYKDLVSCKHNHDVNVCKCAMPILHMGQDEACYSAYALPKKEWCIDGETKLRKKQRSEMMTLYIYLYRNMYKYIHRDKCMYIYT